jgi:hypothetical protein
LLRLNIRVLFVLLQILQPELEVLVAGEDLPNASPKSKQRETITAVARRILPALRQYSIWLVSQAPIVTATVGNGPLNLHIKQMWNLYADVMTTIVGTFPVDNLPTVEYLLEEDEITVGFKPLREPPNIESGINVYIGSNGVLKPRFTDPGMERSHPNVEMLARVRDIILCALSLHLMDQSPIKLNSETKKFIFVEEGLQFPSQIQTQTSQLKPQNPASWKQATSPATQSSAHEVSPQPIRRPAQRSFGDPSSVSQQSIDTDMYRMVDELVETSSGRQSTANETSYGMHTGTANDIFLGKSNGFPGLRQSQQRSTQTMPAIHPGIWASTFTPLPNELPPISPERSNTARHLSPFENDVALREQQFAATTALNAFKGFKEGKSPWDTSDFIPPPLPFKRASQNSEQFDPSSSNLSDNSSVYANHPGSDIRNKTGFRGYHGASNVSNAKIYPGATDYEMFTMLNSSLPKGSQLLTSYVHTPPSGQDG